MPGEIYSRTELTASFRQSEIITDINQYFFNFEENIIDWTTVPYAIVLSQDCDLIQDYNRRQELGSATLNGIILYEAITVETAKAGGMKAREFEKIMQFGMDRYHFLSSVPAECDLIEQSVPDLIVDFKKYFTISPKDLHWQIGKDDGPKRRARLLSPFLEHLQTRTAAFMSRVALPEPLMPSIPFGQIALLPPAPKDA